MRMILGIGIYLCFLNLYSYSQKNINPEIDVSNIKFEHLGIEDGLANSTIKSIIQDDYGFIWFAALNSLCRYDGYEIETYKYDPRNPNSLSGDRITDLKETRNQFLLVGTWQKGLDVFNTFTEKVTHYRHNPVNPNSIGSNQVNSIYIDKDDNIWIGAGHTLNLFDPGSGKFTVYPLKQEELIINSIVEYHNEIWLCTDQLHLFKFDIGKKIFIPLKVIPEEQHDPLIWRCKLYKDTRENLWICTTKNGLYKYNYKTNILENYQNIMDDPFSLSNNNVFDIIEESDGKYWIATDGGGLCYFDLVKKKFYPIKNIAHNNRSLSNNKPHCLLKDNTNIIWIGMYNGGVNIYNPNQIKFQSFKHVPNKPNSLSNNIVWSILEANDGDILIGTDRGGINIYNPQKYGNNFNLIKNEPSNPKSIPSNSCITLFQDIDGVIWIGTYNDGLIKYDKQNNTFTNIKAKRGVINDPSYPAGNDVWDITQDKLNRLWIATLRYGVDVYDTKNKTFIHYNVNNSNLCHNNVTTVFRDSKDRMWVGTANGLCLYNWETKDFITFKHSYQDTASIPGNNIRTFFEDSHHNLWIGTEDAGLCKMDMNNFTCTNFSEEDGIPSNVVYSICEDKSGRLWISTSHGLSCFNVNSNTFQNYTAKEGLQSNEFKQNACLKTRDGRMLFGGIGGFSIFNPENIQGNNYLPPVYITELITIGKEPKKNDSEKFGLSINTMNKIKIHPKNKIIIIKYTSLNYTIPEKNQYMYMLKGFEDDWHKVSNKREATYTNLDPGKYTFKVKACNNDGLWNEKGAEIEMIILSPWYKTIIFRIFLVLITIGLVIFYNYFRVKIIKKQKEDLEIEVKKRTKELQNANFELQQKQDEITTQNEEISQQNEEILTQRDEIEKKSSQLESSYSKIKAFNKFGQEISTLLDINAINQMIHNYVSSLIDTSIFGIGIFNKEKDSIIFNYFVEEDKYLPSFISKIDDPTSNAAWCFKNQKHLFCNDFKTEYDNYISNIKIQTSKVPESLIYIPLTVQDKKIGILTVQSYKRNAYTDEDMETLQTLASYFAIALDNANAYEIVKVQNTELEKHRTELEGLVKERTKDLENAKLKAEESDRLKSAFLANMSHEIRTPLNAIVGFAEILSSGNFEVVPQEEIMKIIEHNSSSLLNIINDIIDFSKIEAGEINIDLKDVNPSPILNEVFFIYTEKMKKERKNKAVKLILNTNSLEIIPILYTDQIRLRQIFCNLLDNAIKYTKKGKIEFGYKSVDHNYLTFYVKDSGIGIKPENFKVIFERFRKIEGEDILYRGTGLGLTITKYLVECLGGKIWLTSEYNSGTEFLFSLPLQDSLAKKQLQPEDDMKNKQATNSNWDSKKILIAEDEVSNFRLLESYLKTSGIEIIWAKNGNEAIKLFTEHTQIDVILMDIKMPGMDGIGAASEIKKLDKKTPIIAQTAYAQPEEEYEIRSSSFNDYISKPIHKNTLISLLSKFLD